MPCPQKLPVSQQSIISKEKRKDARPYQEDLRARPRPLPMAGGEARAQDEEQGQAVRPQEVLLGARQGHRWLLGGLPGVQGRQQVPGQGQWRDEDLQGGPD